MAQTIASQSISKSQAKLLASGFLDSLGKNKDFSDLVLNDSLTTLFQLAGELILETTNNLSAAGNVSSGALSESFKVRNPYYEGQEIHLDVEALYYYEFLNKGVKGTRSGEGKFSFKSDLPSRQMVTEIAAWMERAGMASFNIKKSISNQEVKNKRISQYDSAYAVARSIKMKGIRKTGYFDRAVKTIQDTAITELGKAFKIDLINSLPNNLSDGTDNSK